MQEKDLHKLGKTDLLTVIYKQEKQIQQLTKEVEELKQQLEDRTIQMKEAGSIAEASLKINKIFETAQQAADEYLRSIKEVNKPSQECAEINGDLTKDETNSEISNNFQSKNTYDNKAKDKISKELVLVNNKIMVIKPKLLRRVVIFLMYIFVKIMPFIKSTTENGLKYDVTVKPKILNKEIVDKNENQRTEVAKDEQLPYTGVLNRPIPVLVVAGIAIFCVAWLKVYSTSKKKVK